MSHRVSPSGPLSARFAILEGPEEVEGYELFSGASGGKFLDQGLGHFRENVYVTSVLKEIPQKEAKKEHLSRIASKHEELSAEFHSLTETRCLQLVGADALRSGLGTDQISRFHSSYFTRAEAEALRGLTDPSTLLPLPPQIHTIAVSLHPAFALHGNLQFRTEIVQAIARAHRWSEKESGPTRPSMDLFDLTCQLDDLLRALEQTTTVCIDVETPKDGPGIDLCGFGVPDGRVWVGGWCRDLAEVIQMLMDSNKVIVGHNLLFDLRRFLEMGVKVTSRPIIADTIAGGALLWPPQPQSKKKGKGGPSRLSLAACTLRLLDGHFNWKDPGSPETQALYRANWKVRDWQLPRLYNALDVWGNLKMWWPMRELLRREGML